MYGVKNVDNLIKQSATMLAELVKDKDLFIGHLGKRQLYSFRFKTRYL